MTSVQILSIAVAVLVVVILLGWYLMFLASRLDRLHRRVEGARLVLDNQLFQRSTAALELAGSGAMDPASAMVLADAATDALGAIHARQDATVADPYQRTLLAAKDEDLERAESNLTRVLGATVVARVQAAQNPASPGLTPDLLMELSAACQRVSMARKFHNDAVLAAQAVRRKRLVRFAHLAGSAPLPLTVEFDDEIPRALSEA